MSFIKEKLNDIKISKYEDKTAKDHKINKELSFSEFDYKILDFMQPTFDKINKLCLNKKSLHVSLKGDNYRIDEENLISICEDFIYPFKLEMKDLKNFALREYNACTFSNFNRDLNQGDYLLISKECKKSTLKDYFRGIQSIERKLIENAFGNYI